MKLLDSKGRLFGKISLLDAGALGIILLTLAGILLPSSPGSIAQVAPTKPIEVDILVRGLSVGDPQDLKTQLQPGKKASIILRNQPAGEVEVKSYKELPRTVSVPQPDGTVKALPDPRPELDYTQDLILTVAGNGEVTANGAVLGNQKVKIGTQIELDGVNYNFKGSAIAVRS